MPPVPESITQFCKGLYPILLAGDVDAFSRYLSQWEDVIGDTAELTTTSEAQQRRTMTALLCHPKQFNLPPWPRAVPVSEPTIDDRATPPPQHQGWSDVPLSPSPPVQDDPTGHVDSAEAAFQLDMLTGEFIPVERSHVRPQAEALPERTETPRRKRQPRRTPGVHLVQLPLLDAGASAD